MAIGTVWVFDYDPLARRVFFKYFKNLNILNQPHSLDANVQVISKNVFFRRVYLS